VSQRGNNGLAFLVDDRPAEAFEQLDSALRVISLRNWLTLAVVLFTIATFLVFSCFYRAPLKVEGRGIILAKSIGEDDPLLQVTAPAAGRLARVNVKIGDVVKPGEILGLIDQGELQDQIEEATADIKRLEDEDTELTKLDAEASQKKNDALNRLDQTLKVILSLDQNRLTINQWLHRSDTTLTKRGYMTKDVALKSRAEADAVESAIGNTQAKLHEIQFDRVEDFTRRRMEKVKRRLGIIAANTKLSLLQNRFKRDTQVISPFALEGTVVDLMITPHALVEKGAPVALLRPVSHVERPMEAIVFVPAGMGKKIRVGFPVEISPDTVRRHEHGYIMGMVTSRSEIPATEMAMLAELKHKMLVASFVERYAGEVLLCIHVELHQRHGKMDEFNNGVTENHLQWSSVSGSTQRVTNGTLCGAEIVLERRPLITLALPWVKRLFGIH